MKAKEFAKQYLSSDNKSEESVKIARTFLSDFENMKQTRKAVSDSAIFSLLNEFDNKYKTYAMLVNKKLPETAPIPYNGFRNLIYLSFPKIKEYW